MTSGVGERRSIGWLGSGGDGIREFLGDAVDIGAEILGVEEEDEFSVFDFGSTVRHLG